MNNWFIHHGDALEVLKTLPAESVHCCVTSPPYFGLRDYGIEGQIGLEPTVEEYVQKMVAVFREVRRVLRADGTLWLNIGDSYAGSWGNYHPNSPPGKHGQRVKETARWNRPAYQSQEFLPPTANLKSCKPKDLIGVPWQLAFALRSDGWYLRQDIIWAKPNPMPESVTDRCTKAHEYLFLLSKSARYYFNQEAILEPCSPGTHERRSRDDRREKEGWDAAYMGNPPRGLAGNGSGGRKDLPETQANLGAYRDRQRKLAAPGSGTKNNSSFDAAMAIMPEKRNKRSVWEVTTQGYSEAHFATFPPKLVEPCILAGCPQDGTVLDPFAGAGTTGLVARRLGRSFIGIELNQDYVAMASRRITDDQPLFNTVAHQPQAEGP